MVVVVTNLCVLRFLTMVIEEIYCKFECPQRSGILGFSVAEFTINLQIEFNFDSSLP